MRNVSEWFVVGIVMAIVGGLLWFAVQGIERPDGPAGRPIPTEPPDEANRVHHRSGISIVLPPNWVLSKLDFFDARPRGVPGKRSKAMLVIMANGDRGLLNVEGLAPVSFQGQPAYEKMIVERHDTFDDPAMSRYTLQFQRDGRSYFVHYGIAEERTELPPMVRRYLETLAFETPPDVDQAK